MSLVNCIGSCCTTNNTTTVHLDCSDSILAWSGAKIFIKQNRTINLFFVFTKHATRKGLSASDRSTLALPFTETLKNLLLFQSLKFFKTKLDQNQSSNSCYFYTKPCKSHTIVATLKSNVRAYSYSDRDVTIAVVLIRRG